MLNLERWLRPLLETEPCGPDLEYDNDLIALEQAGQGKPDQQDGNTIIPATPPDWKTVRDLADSLLDKTRDLRFAAWSSRSIRIVSFPSAMMGPPACGTSETTN